MGHGKEKGLLLDRHGKSMSTTSSKRAKRKNTHVCYRRVPITGAKWAGAVGKIKSLSLTQQNYNVSKISQKTNRGSLEINHEVKRSFAIFVPEEPNDHLADDTSFNLTYGSPYQFYSSKKSSSSSPLRTRHVATRTGSGLLSSSHRVAAGVFRVLESARALARCTPEDEWRLSSHTPPI